MRLTVNLDSDLYALVVSLAKTVDCSISAAVKRLPRRSLPGASDRGAPLHRRNHFVVSRGRKPITPDAVDRVEADDDTA